LPGTVLETRTPGLEPFPGPEAALRTLLGVALALIVLWIVARIVLGVTAILIHLVLVAAAILLIWMLVRAVAGGTRTTP
jgi:hypothetical protein